MKRIFSTIILLAITALPLNNALGDIIEIEPNRTAVIIPPDSLNNDDNGPRLLRYFELPENVNGKHIDYAEISASGDFPSYGRLNLITMEFYPVTTEWGNDPNWRYPWAENGGDFDEDERNFYTVHAGTSRKVMFDITPVVNAWNNGNSDNHGVIVVPRKMNRLAYKSFQHNSPILSRIKLKIHYSRGFSE